MTPDALGQALSAAPSVPEAPSATPAPPEAAAAPPVAAPEPAIPAPAPPPTSPDPVENYNTPLEPADEAKFQHFLAESGKQGDLENYDLRGFWKNNAHLAENGHGPDTWKKPNHPTFSDESIYSGPYATGGKWVPLAHGKWRFDASPDNLKHQTPEELQDYFRRIEPGNALVLPPQ